MSKRVADYSILFFLHNFIFNNESGIQPPSLCYHNILFTGLTLQVILYVLLYAFFNVVGVALYERLAHNVLI